jgi:hypothetical protein
VDSKRQAEASRAKHGRSKAEKALADTARQRRDATLDGARRDRTED